MKFHEASSKVGIYNRRPVALSTGIRMPLMQVPCQLSCFHFDKCLTCYDVLPSTNEYSNCVLRGADSDSQVGGIIMASAASLKKFLLAGGQSPPETAKLTMLE
jgi:hypothetical protein